MLVDDNYYYEKKLWAQNYQLIMGLDEVGRGCLAGPVVAAGVILRPNSFIADVTDSKVLTKTRREELSEIIKKEALCWTVQSCSVSEIEEQNIYWASFSAMRKCVEKASEKPDYLLIDGNRYPNEIIPVTCLVKGDLLSASIGAASIIAKVYRDNLMLRLHNDFPGYGWNTNVGYATKKHYEGLGEFGPTKHHRKTFRLEPLKLSVDVSVTK
ncbi:MAG: ribonuclease HII [Balneolales bacterium]